MSFVPIRRRTADSSEVDGELDPRPGEVVGIAGGSGSGKSALIDSLAVSLGTRVIRDPDAVAMDLSVAENVCLGAEPRNRFRLVSRRALTKRAAEVLTALDVSIDPRSPVRQLSPALRCVVQAANGVATGAKIIAFDGLSAVLPWEEVRRLDPVFGKLARMGVAVVYASRCAEELRACCDRIVVLDKEGLPKPRAERSLDTDEPVLEVRGLRTGPDVVDVSFSVGGGEIVAVIGFGGRDVGKALFGITPVVAGEILVHGTPLRLRSPRDAVRAGVGYLSDRTEALVPGQTIAKNLRMLAPSSTWSRRAQQRLVSDAQTLLGVSYPDSDTPVDRLSEAESRILGFAKWLAAESEVLVIDEPGSATNLEIRLVIRELAAAGVAVVVISTDAAEVIDLADRVIALRHGKVSSDATGFLGEGAA